VQRPCRNHRGRGNLSRFQRREAQEEKCLCAQERQLQGAEVEESFEDSKRTKLRRESAFIHRALQVIVEAERDPLEGLSSEEAQEEKHFQRTRIKAEVTGFVAGSKGRGL
jgi:hypothetical protein